MCLRETDSEKVNYIEIAGLDAAAAAAAAAVVVVAVRYKKITLFSNYWDVN